jgi:hypothetical protein
MDFAQRGAVIRVYTGKGSSNIILDFAKPTTRLLHISYLHYLPHQAIQAMWRQTVFVGTSKKSMVLFISDRLAGSSIAICSLVHLQH